MDVDHDLMINKHSYGDYILDQLVKDCQWSSLLDGADASPSEILADATSLLIPPISPLLSTNSTPSSSQSDSGSDDDSKNSSSSASARQSSLSPFDWLTGFDEPSYDLSPEDVDLFLLKKEKPSEQQIHEEKIFNQTRKGPVVSIENGVIEGIQFKRKSCVTVTSQSPTTKGNFNGYMQNSFYKIENEQPILNLNIKEEKPYPSQNIKEEKPVPSQNIKLVVESKTVPSILKRSNAPNQSIVIPDSTNGRKIILSPLSRTNGVADTNRVSPRNIVINAASIPQNIPSGPVQNYVIPKTEIIDGVDLSNCSEVEIRALKKQQRMIKNRLENYLYVKFQPDPFSSFGMKRESALQSRQKKKDYVTALEHELLEAKQEIARLRRENHLLRDQLSNGGRGRKIPRLDTSLFIPKKNIAVLFAMVFMVSLNFNVLGWNSKPFVGPSAPHTNTRHLLWAEENAINIESGSDEITNSTYNSDCHNATMKANEAVNQTESIRIAGELKRWIGSGKSLNWTYDVPRRKRGYLNEERIHNGLLESYRLFNKLHLDNLIEIPSTKSRNIRDKARLRRLRRKDLEFENVVINYDNLYRKPLRKAAEFIDDFGEWNALLQALHRRDDTFYVVGVGKGEHLLLPAVSHNITRPPKMALILPARSGNDSTLSDHVTLMQIDCSVVNTTIVQLKSDALPGSLRKKSEDTKSPVYGNPKPKKIINKTNDGLPILHNTNDNTSDYSNSQTKNADLVQEDGFASYLVTKYEHTKKDEVRNKKRRSVSSGQKYTNDIKNP